jgi:hypothetical protein
MIRSIKISSLMLCVLMISACSGNQSKNENPTISKPVITQKVENQEPKVNQSLESRNVLNGLVQIKLPSHFEPMPEALLKVKYPSGNAPTEVYSNADGRVNVALNHTSNQVSKEKLPALLPAFVSQFSKSYPSINWKQKTATEKGLLLEFETPSVDTPIYNLMAVQSLNGKMLMVSFNCPLPLQKEWEIKAHEIIGSIDY